MPIISTIGRKALHVRVLIGVIYAVLIAGSITMIYPFLLMVAGSTASNLDTPDTRVVPGFLGDDTALYAKYLEGQFNESLRFMNATYDLHAPTFRDPRPSACHSSAFVKVWADFVEQVELPATTYTVGFMDTPLSRNALPHTLRRFKRVVQSEFDTDLAAANEHLGTRFHSWSAFRLRLSTYLLRRDKPDTSPLSLRFDAFKAAVPHPQRVYFNPEGFFKAGFLKTRYSKAIGAYNDAHGTHYTSWADVHLDVRVPEGPGRTAAEREDWTTFTRSLLNLLWLRADAAAAPSYRAYLKARHLTIDALNRNYGTAYPRFESVPLVQAPPEGARFSDWDAFVQGWRDPETGRTHRLAAESIRVHTVATQFRDLLRQRYDTLSALNGAMGTAFPTWEHVVPPQRDWHYQAFVESRTALRWEFVRRNYVSVVEFIVLHGRGVLNTAIYCLLQILCALTVNPLAAYALSRYKPPSAYKILLFLMLTMAFPPMVTQIPNFLMLRELGLLNTFWALILPGMAHGYSIFLLKGFFDSLPRELYESAQIDGAGEFRIFWQITMSLSKPILAVIALNAFTMAYSNFMMALLICQDHRMWTLMPWLYQLQQDSCQGVIYASLLIAALPTLIVFVFCQNVIMRGIVVPVEK